MLTLKSLSESMVRLFLGLKLTHHTIAIGERPEKLSTTKVVDDKQYGHNDDKNAYTPHR